MLKTKRLAGGLIALALLAATPVAAHADSYVGGTDNQNFATGSGGWTQSAEFGGLCLPSLLCPAVNDDWVSSGGADGNGYIRTQFASVASTVAGTSVGVWQSPAFTYNGNGGKVPSNVALGLAIRPQVSALLGVTAVNDSSYRVDIVDVATGLAIGAVPSTPLVNDAGWTAVPSVAIDPASLSIGRAYAIRISTTYHAVATVVATGEVGYDDVTLTTSGTAPGGGTNGGSGITSTHQLRVLVRNEALPGSVKLVGHTLKMTIKCPNEASPLSCKMSVHGVSHGKGSAVTTSGKLLTMKAGNKKVVRLIIRKAYLAKYKHATHVFIRARVRVGIFKVTVVKRVKLIH